MSSSRAELAAAIAGIKTDARRPGEPKDPDASTLFALHRAIATPDESDTLRRAFADGMGWGDIKAILVDRVDAELAPARARYEALMAAPAAIEEILKDGARKARARIAPLMAAARHAVGIRPLTALPPTAVPPPEKTAVPSPPRVKSYREGAPAYFKLLGDGDAVLLQSRAYPSPRDAGQAAAGLVAAGPAVTPAALAAALGVPVAALPENQVAAFRAAFP